MEFFLHPWFMAAGGALISSPILIHLINRMRFRRIRWAAMEFLLKSQKRNRRRLIIEQLILLFLRILLVLLAAFLVARFIYAGISPDKLVSHLVFVDDTLSMRDRGAEGTAFDEAKRQVVEMARSAAGSPLTHRMQVRLLSRPDTSIFNDELKDATVSNLEGVLSQQKPTYRGGPPLVAFQKAQEFFAGIPEGQKVFALVSDFRANDWVIGGTVEPLNQSITRLREEGIHVNLVDVAGPPRGKTRQAAAYHNNLSVASVRAEARMVAENVPVDFQVDIANNGDSTASTFLKVKIDGQEDFSAAQPVANIPAGQTRSIRFPLLFAKKSDSPEIGGGDSNAVRDQKRRLEREFRRVTVEISPEEVGLNSDNVRDLVIEVRRKVPALVVSGSGTEGRLPGGDVFHVMVAFFAARAYDVEVRSLQDLADTDLDLYPSIFMLNVKDIPDENLQARLDEYVNNGGSIAYFMGEKVDPKFYNDTLHRKYKGLFPVLIEDRPTDPLNPLRRLNAEERAELRERRLQRDPQPKIVIKEEDSKHPVNATLYPRREVFRYLPIDQYYRTQPEAEWVTSKEARHTLIYMPNYGSLNEFKTTANARATRANELTQELADEDPAFKKYVAPVENHYRRIRQVLADPNSFLFDLVQALESLRKDPGNRDEPDKFPDMRTLWAQPKMKALGGQIDDLLNKLSSGDPLVVTSNHGRGRVVAVLTSAGTEWNDWGTGSPASWTYPVFLMDLQRHLVSEGDDFNRLVGDQLTIQKPVAGYQAEVGRKYQRQPEPVAGAEEQPGGGLPQIEDQGKQPLRADKDTLTFRFEDGTEPGVYTFDFYPQVGPDGAAKPTETLAYAFNVDPRESDLKRAPRDKLERPQTEEGSRQGTVVLRTPGDSYEDYQDRNPDASESPWLFLFILLVLVIEQALAVHLSFHLRGDENTATTAAGGAVHHAPLT